jgi:hypothetical protein
VWPTPELQPRAMLLHRKVMCGTRCPRQCSSSYYTCHRTRGARCAATAAAAAAAVAWTTASAASCRCDDAAVSEVRGVRVIHLSLRLALLRKFI